MARKQCSLGRGSRLEQVVDPVEARSGTQWSPNRQVRAGGRAPGGAGASNGGPAVGHNSHRLQGGVEEVERRRCSGVEGRT